jgi:hypothetical protein
LIVEQALTDACDFSTTITIPDMNFRLKPGTKHNVFRVVFRVRYLGNAVLSAKNARAAYAEGVGFHA